MKTNLNLHAYDGTSDLASTAASESRRAFDRIEKAEAEKAELRRKVLAANPDAPADFGGMLMNYPTILRWFASKLEETSK